MAASLMNRNCSRILKKCKDISVRRYYRRQTKLQIKKPRSPYNTSFISFPRIKDVGATIEIPEDLKTFSGKLEGDTDTNYDN